jgi:hypothetical protein
MSLADTAQRLIQANGRTVRLHFTPTAPTTPSQPWKGNTNPPAGATLDVKAVFESETEGELARSLFAALSGASGVPPRRPRNSFLVAGLDLAGVDYSAVQEVTDGGQKWRCTGVEPVQPGDTLFLVTFEVRQ